MYWTFFGPCLTNANDRDRFNLFLWQPSPWVKCNVWMRMSRSHLFDTKLYTQFIRETWFLEINLMHKILWYSEWVGRCVVPWIIYDFNWYRWGSDKTVCFFFIFILNEDNWILRLILFIFSLMNKRKALNILQMPENAFQNEGVSDIFHWIGLWLHLFLALNEHICTMFATRFIRAHNCATAKRFKPKTSQCASKTGTIGTHSTRTQYNGLIVRKRKCRSIDWACSHLHVIKIDN